MLTYGAGVELMQLMDEVHAVLGVAPEQWPGRICSQRCKALPGDCRGGAGPGLGDRIINLDTWFMPCFLARLLLDAGANVEGNYIKQLHRGAQPAVAQQPADPVLILKMAIFWPVVIPDARLVQSFVDHEPGGGQLPRVLSAALLWHGRRAGYFIAHRRRCRFQGGARGEEHHCPLSLR